MAKGTCSIDGCDKPVRCGGKCGPHYHQWRCSRLVCSIEGCGKPGFGRGWCTAHYTRWQRYGDPLAELTRESPRTADDHDKPKRCSRCKETKPADQFGRNIRRVDGLAAWCFQCNCDAVSEHNATNPDRKLMRREYALRRRNNVRASRFKVTVHDLRRLVARYGGLCAYCPNPWKQFDHVVPVSRGGRHSIGNLVPACVRCNTSKNDALVMEWRLAIGGPRKGRKRAA
jgi:hypothetical protein